MDIDGFKLTARIELLTKLGANVLTATLSNRCDEYHRDRRDGKWSRNWNTSKLCLILSDVGGMNWYIPEGKKAALITKLQQSKPAVKVFGHDCPWMFSKTSGVPIQLELLKQALRNVEVCECVVTRVGGKVPIDKFFSLFSSDDQDEDMGECLLVCLFVLFVFFFFFILLFFIFYFCF